MNHDELLRKAADRFKSAKREIDLGLATLSEVARVERLSGRRDAKP